MKKGLLITILTLASIAVEAQVTLLKGNKSLGFSYIQINGKALMISNTDKTLWATDGTPGGTIQLSSTIKVGDGGAVLNGNYIFPGTTNETGEEVFITDGTITGTHIIKDIFTGTTGSKPDEDFAVLNGFVYFTAANAENGRELWKTNGTLSGTSLVKDIIAGPSDSNSPDSYELFSNGNYLLFSAKTVAAGTELYKSDGTDAGTNVLFDINPGTPSSNADMFFSYNNAVLFTAKTALNGVELWKTDGTPGGTSMVKESTTGPLDAMSTVFFYPFNGKLLFTANNGSNGEELWITDGTTANTALVKDINQGAGSSFASLFASVKVGNRLIFSASNASSSPMAGIPELPTNTELWETDGTEIGTHLFKEIVNGPVGSYPFVMPSFDFTSGALTNPLFQGNKFFFIAKTPALGMELWISDGTSDGTHIVKDINPGSEDGISNASYMYTSNALFFSADNGVNGSELWKSDGTDGGTVMVADINGNTDPADSDSDIEFGILLTDKILFAANDGDSNNDDLFRLDGSFTSLPITLSDFTVTPKSADAVLGWTTLTELNAKEFLVQRSDDGIHFETIGTVQAKGNSIEKQGYNFTDKEICVSGKTIVYYRLITSDKDGKSKSESKVISLKLKGTSEWSVKLIRNPVVSEINLLLSNVTEPIKISVKDMSGRGLPIGTTAFTSGQINLSTFNLLNGVYLIVAETNKERKVIKFVK